MTNNQRDQKMLLQTEMSVFDLQKFYLNSGLLCRDGREKVEGRESRILRQDEQQSEGKTKPTPDRNEYA